MRVHREHPALKAAVKQIADNAAAEVVRIVGSSDDGDMAWTEEYVQRTQHGIPLVR